MTLPLATTNRSVSLLSVGMSFWSLNTATRLVPAVDASGVGRFSQVPVDAFLACHALRPWQVPADLACVGLFLVEFR